MSPLSGRPTAAASEIKGYSQPFNFDTRIANPFIEKAGTHGHKVRMENIFNRMNGIQDTYKNHMTLAQYEVRQKDHRERRVKQHVVERNVKTILKQDLELKVRADNRKETQAKNLQLNRERSQEKLVDARQIIELEKKLVFDAMIQGDKKMNKILQDQLAKRREAQEIIASYGKVKSEKLDLENNAMSPLEYKINR